MRDQNEIFQTLLTAVDFLRLGVSRFQAAGLAYGHGTDNALDEARVLLCHALDLPLDVPDALLNGRLLPVEKERVVALLERRVSERIPAPYLTGEAWFAGLRFTVDERVIIPRSPIAELIETGFTPWLAAPEAVTDVLDMCTGSGCIAIGCAYAFPNAHVDGADISQDAIAVAERNVAEHGLGARVSIVESDVFDAITAKRYQLIVANPPYVGLAEFDELPPEYHREPRLALTADEDGLAIVRRILERAAAFLSDDGILVIELGNSALLAAETWPQLPFTWLEFERGGHGVGLLHAADLATFDAGAQADRGTSDVR